MQVDKPAAELSPVLYGLFFEDINYAADGGLYAELVQNRSFEYHPIPGQPNTQKTMHALAAWEKIARDGGAVELNVVSDQPLNKNNTKYLQMTIRQPGEVGVRNTGFDGVALKAGERYYFSVYARRTQDFEKPLRVALVSPNGEQIATASIPRVDSEWGQHELTLTASKSESSARLEITTSGGGDVMLDMVSLFPQNTFKGRKNGVRADLAQSLADLKPGFLRFPGGCLVHGEGLANAYRWKDTVGDVANRKPNWNLWGYHQTYGLGYYEYFQLCEDIGAAPLPVLPVGVACGFRRPFDTAPMDELHEWVGDALDLIEFANGSTSTKWGKLRAEMGHPEPFGLEYLCLGNEEHDTAEVRDRFPHFVDAIRERHPEIKIVGTSGLGPEIPLCDLMVQNHVYSTDEHYYMPPNWYLENAARFDSFRRNEPKVFVGEYASEGNTQFNAVAEAAYLTGVERNADIVDMTCYAPLFAKYDFTQWPRADLIWFDNQELVKTPNYYVQQLFSTNKGNVYLENNVSMTGDTLSQREFAGRVGVGAWRTAIEVQSAKLNGKRLDFSDWEVLRGDFARTDQGYAQRDAQVEGAISLAPTRAEGDKIVFEVRARKTGGNEGFLLVFGHQGDDNHFWWNVGGWGNTEHAIQRTVGSNSHERVASARGSIESNRWYDLRIELTPGRIRCFLDDQLIHDFQDKLAEVYASPTFDKSTGEVMVKLVNPRETSVNAVIRLQGDANPTGEARVTTLAAPRGAVNTIADEQVRPEHSTLPAEKTLRIELPPTSVQVVRVKVR